MFGVGELRAKRRVLHIWPGTSDEEHFTAAYFYLLTKEMFFHFNLFPLSLSLLSRCWKDKPESPTETDVSLFEILVTVGMKIHHHVRWNILPHPRGWGEETGGGGYKKQERLLRSVLGSGGQASCSCDDVINKPEFVLCAAVLASGEKTAVCPAADGSFMDSRKVQQNFNDVHWWIQLRSTDHKVH